jgi:alpha-ketoglutarate-dependent taurine dioxygenase
MLSLAVTGWKSLFLNRKVRLISLLREKAELTLLFSQFTTRIIGLEKSESDLLLNSLFDACASTSSLSGMRPSY